MQAAQGGWCGAKGPIAAGLLTLRRIGWRATNWHQWITHEGHELNLKEHSPSCVRKAVDHATTNWQWQRVAAKPGHEELDQGAIDGPLRSLLKATGKDLSPQERALLRTTIVGGESAPERMFKAGMLPTPACQAPGCVQVGTLKHRHFQCEASKSFRESHAPGITQLANAAEAASTFWCKLLVPISMLQCKGPATDLCLQWWRPFAKVLQGEIFVDGSAKHVGIPILSRAGMAAACFVGDTHDVQQAVWGNLPAGPYKQGAPGAEVWGLLLAVRHAAGAIHLVTDCKNNYEALLMGKEYCLRAANPWAHVWRQIWEHLQSLPAWSVRWVKAHATEDQIAAGVISRLDYERNQKIDTLANEGREKHPSHASAVQAYERSSRQIDKCAVMLAKQAMARLVGTLPADAPTLKKGRGHKAPRSRCQVEHNTTHVLTPGPSHWTCIACGQQTHNPAKLKDKPCWGAEEATSWQMEPPAWAEAAKAIAAHCTHARGHSLISCQPYLVCLTCGAYGSRGKARKLHQPCTPLSPVRYREKVLNCFLRQKHPYTGARTEPVAAASTAATKHALERKPWVSRGFRHADRLHRLSRQLKQQEQQPPPAQPGQNWSWLTCEPCQSRVRAGGTKGRKRPQMQAERSRRTRPRA